MIRLVVFLLLFSFSSASGQVLINLNERISDVSFEHSIKVKKRSFVGFNKKASYLNPVNYIGAIVLYVYQNVFSEQIQANCTYEISCSEYTKLSIQKFGFFKGFLIGFNQLSECSPNAIYEHPPIYLNENQKVINRIE